MLDATGNDVIDFGDVSLQTRRLKINGKAYLLREATEDVACKYQNARIKELVMGPDGKPSGLRNVADVGPYLVSLCLFEITERGEVAVPVKQVREWPSRLVSQLTDMAKKMSRLDDEETAEALEKRIASDQEKLAKLRNGHSEQTEKNS